MRGKRWATSSVHNILNSTAVQGLTTFNRRSDGGHGIENDPSQWVIVQSHDAIVPDELVQRARSMMKDAAPTAKGSPLSTNFFIGFANVGLCGGPVVVQAAKIGRARG